MQQAEHVEYPINPKKYSGHISITKAGNFCLSIRAKTIRYNRTFYSYEEALKAQREKNIEFGLPIINKLYPQIIDGKIDHYEVECKLGQRFKISPEDLQIIDKYCWFLHRGYAMAVVGDRQTMLHNMIMNHTPTDGQTVDHINRNPSDNRRGNLRIVDHQTQCINRNSPCMAGYAGVSKAECRQGQYYIATWVDESGKSCSKWFRFGLYHGGESTALKLAIEHRQKMERELPHYRKALGLPEPDQKEEKKE